MAKVVLKVGSNLLVGQGGIKKEYIIEMVATVNKLLNNKHRVAIVTSGAAASGRKVLKIDTHDMVSKQALCAVGQVQLMNIYENAFSFYNRKVAQILLTRDDFSDRTRFLNLRNTLIGLENFKVIPIINENDTVAVEEIKLGDNDILSAMFSICWGADYLLLLTSVDGVIGENGEIVKEYVVGFDQVKIAKLEKTSFGSGGIDSKIIAGRMAAESGIKTYIINGNELGNILRVLNGENPGTRFVVQSGRRLSKRLSWLKYISKPKGRIYVNDGAFEAMSKRKSLLPVGILKVEGKFDKGDVVSIYFNDKLFAKGIVNYSSDEVEVIKGMKTNEIPEDIFTYEEVIHADNTILEGKL
ncbi:MAG: glutamate 5-kinase [Fervidobacterium sp.]|nr:glutamate 5-kinase [Fervidobacterium sp.]